MKLAYLGIIPVLLVLASLGSPSFAQEPADTPAPSEGAPPQNPAPKTDPAIISETPPAIAVLSQAFEFPSRAFPERPAIPTTGLRLEPAPGTILNFDGLLRGFYRNDQRIYWSGVEETFGAEGVLRAVLDSTHGRWNIGGQAEFFINQPFGSSILSDPERDLYRTNFEVDAFEIFQLYAQVKYGDFALRMGKARTPFGAYYGPAFSNSLFDAPFIRTEVIPWTETGLFLSYRGLVSLDAALTNGEPNLDTNSSKALVARVGIDRELWTLGASIKAHDGISSEYQKRYNNIVGIDWSLRRGRFILYGETTYDQHGFWRNFDLYGNPMNLGVRSLYHRDVYSGRDESPVSGVGYYVAFGYHGERWLFDGSFGSYYPQRLGIAAHDAVIHRGVVKVAYAFTPAFHVYTVGLVENDRPRDGVLANDIPYGILVGLQLGY